MFRPHHPPHTQPVADAFVHIIMTSDYNADEVDVLANRNLNTIDATEEAFDDYDATTIDPGCILFVIALVVCVSSILGLALLSRIGREPFVRRIAKINDWIYGNRRDTETALIPVQNESNEAQVQAPAESNIGSDQIGVNYDEHLLIRTEVERFLRDSLLLFWKVAKYDRETHRIIRLVVPFTFSALARSLSELLILAIISHTLGTDAMVAYAIVGGIVGVTSAFMGGWHESVLSLASMAYGARNYELTGKYVQVSCILYITCESPVAFVWAITMRRLVLLMGFEQSVANFAQGYVVVRLLSNMVLGLISCVLGFLDLIEKERFANTMYCISSIIRVVSVLVAVKIHASLGTLGVVILVDYCMLFLFLVLIPLKMGWLEKFENGLFGRLSPKDMVAVNGLFRVALPLAFGGLLAYAEWEILTVLAAILGPAEAATWAVMGYIWGVFESTTDAVGDASEIRVAYRLGKGRPDLAKLASYKSMFIAAALSIVMSIILLSLTNILPSLMTHDATIQGMLAELFPLVALGNATMSMGMVCWAIVGAQGRYHISTMIATGCAFLITIPVGFLLTVGIRINLQGLTFAVVVGYTVTAMLISALIVLSDWEMLSKNIQMQMDAEGDGSSADSSDWSKSSRLETPPLHICLPQSHDQILKAPGLMDYIEVHQTSPVYFSDYREVPASSFKSSKKNQGDRHIPTAGGIVDDDLELPAIKSSSSNNSQKNRPEIPFTNNQPTPSTTPKDCHIPNAQDIEDAKKWRAVFDRSSLQCYYYHTETRKASWEKPLGYDEAQRYLPPGSQESAIVVTPWTSDGTRKGHLERKRSWLFAIFGYGKPSRIRSTAAFNCLSDAILPGFRKQPRRRRF